MTYMLRDRLDGQVEIILQQPILVGIFAERESAQRVCAFLSETALEMPEDQPAGFATATADVAELEAEIESLDPPVFMPSRRNLPAIVPDKPSAPAFLKLAPTELTEDQREAAFRRISEGERLSDVAVDIGVGIAQLRGMWTGHKRRLQAHIAVGGQIQCKMCTKEFTPSISHPDTCARCSHE